MGDLKEAGCVAVSNVHPISNTNVLRHAMEYAANCHLPLFLYAQDPWLGRKGCAHEGAVSTRLGLSGIPEVAETIEVSRNLLLIEMTGVTAHFCRLSTAKAVAMVKAAQAKGLPVTADVSTHHLFLTDEDIGDYHSQCHVIPPLRTQADKKGLRAGLIEGGINAICSDHQPHEADAKLSPFALTAPGISGLDTLLPLTLKLAEEMQLDLLTALGYVTSHPAKILGIPTGTLAIGRPADICIFDPHGTWTLTAENMRSSGHNSPFLGWEWRGKVSYTVVNGRVVYSLVDSDLSG
jgi:dihydroorotase